MRKFLILIATAFAVFTVSAHNADTKFFDNTYVRITGGATALTSPEYAGYENFGHSIQGVIGAEIGKWITPNWGIAFSGDFGLRNGSEYGFAQYYDPYAHFNTELKRNLYKGDLKSNTFNYITVTGLVKGNITNILFGYKPRTVEFVLATGPMWIHGYPSNVRNGHSTYPHQYYANDFGVKFQGEVNFNVSKRVQINIVPEFNYNLTGACGDQPQFDSRYSWWGVQAGVTYKIGNQFKTCEYTYTQADVDALNVEINNLRNRQPEVVEKVIIKEINVEVPNIIVIFDKDSSILTNEAKQKLDVITGKVDVIGSASPEGSETHNEELASERAQVVANYLINKGVNINSITTDTSIGSRVAIVK